MTYPIPESYRDLIDGPVVVALTTIMPSGQPQTTPVWCSAADGYILINTARGRQKARNMDRNPRISILAIDPANPYRYLEVRGHVIEVTEDGAVDHINQMAQLYRGKPFYYGHTAPADLAQRETRVLYKIKPDRILARG